MLHRHGEVSNILFDSGPTGNLQSLQRGLYSIYLTSASDLFGKDIASAADAKTREDGVLWLPELK